MRTALKHTKREFKIGPKNIFLHYYTVCSFIAYSIFINTKEQVIMCKKYKRKHEEMEIDYKALGMRIRQKRIEKHLTQDALAAIVGVTNPHFSNIETGKTKVSLPTLIAISNALSVSTDRLLCDNVMPSQIIFEEEAKELFADCDEYEVRILVDMLRSIKDILRRNKELQNRFMD